MTNEIRKNIFLLNKSKNKYTLFGEKGKIWEIDLTFL